MSKLQRGFRLQEETLAKIDRFGEKMGWSYNKVCETCVEHFFPVLDTHEYYKAKLEGFSEQDIASAIVITLREMVKGRK